MLPKPPPEREVGRELPNRTLGGSKAAIEDVMLFCRRVLVSASITGGSNASAVKGRRFAFAFVAMVARGGSDAQSTPRWRAAASLLQSFPETPDPISDTNLDLTSLHMHPLHKHNL